MTFPFAPAPADFEATGPLPDVAARFAAHLAAEERTTWTAASSALVFGEAGTLGTSGGYPQAALEEGGFRALMVYYNERFPRATPVFSLLAAPSMARVWRELFDPTDRRFVQVGERSTPVGRAVYAVTPPTYATTYDAAGVVLDVARMLTGASGEVVLRASLTYTAATLDAQLVLAFADYLLVLTITDRYGEEVVRVRVHDLHGADLGDPAPDVKKRRYANAAAGDGITIARGVATKITAAPEYFARARQQSQLKGVS